MTRCWHVEHADGREWTPLEIEGLTMHGDEWVGSVGLDAHGAPILLNRFCRWCYADDVTDDMVVSWDD